MTEHPRSVPSHDVVVVGAGPAGLAAAAHAAERGLRVLLLDEQAAPGGRVWHAAGAILAEARDAPHSARARLAAGYDGAQAALARLDASGVVHARRAIVVDVVGPEGDGAGATVTWLAQGGGTPRIVSATARALVVATGAMERPLLFPGGHLPGVMGVGALQTAMKRSGLVPDGRDVVLAGHGPLLLLTLAQIHALRGRVGAVLDLGPPGALRRAANRLPAALAADAGLLARGAGLVARRALSGVAIHRGVTRLRAHGGEAGGAGGISEISFLARGRPVRLPCTLLGVHDGVVPDTQIARLLGLAHRWNEAQGAFAPVVDARGRSSLPGVWVVGDGAGIGGADVAALAGAACGLDVAEALGAARADPEAARSLARSLARKRTARGFVEALYPPLPVAAHADDDTVLCRCETVTVGAVRAAMRLGADGPNRVKVFTRCGMGPCQGRMCSNALTRLVAAETGRAPDDVGALRTRSPLKPVLLRDYLPEHLLEAPS